MVSLRFACVTLLAASASAASLGPAQAHQVDRIDIDYDVPQAGFGEVKLTRDSETEAHVATSFLGSQTKGQPEVTLHVPVPSISERQASVQLSRAKSQFEVLQELANKQNALESLLPAMLRN